MTRPIPNMSEDEERYIETILSAADEILEIRGDSAEESYVTVEANTLVYLITRYRSLCGRGNVN